MLYTDQSQKWDFSCCVQGRHVLVIINCIHSLTLMWNSREYRWVAETDVCKVGQKDFSTSNWQSVCLWLGFVTLRSYSPLRLCKMWIGTDFYSWFLVGAFFSGVPLVKASRNRQGGMRTDLCEVRWVGEKICEGQEQGARGSESDWEKYKVVMTFCGFI